MNRDGVISVVREFMNTVGVYPVVNIAKLVDNVCDIMKITPEELRSKNKPQHLVIARQMICIYLTIYSNLSPRKIGLIINRDRTSVLYLVKIGMEQTVNGTALYVKNYFAELKKRMQDETSNF